MSSGLVRIKKKSPVITVVIPCFKARDHILDVIRKIGQEVTHIVLVDDKCPEGSGLYVKDSKIDNRVLVIFNEDNLGVGGATIVGYKKSLELSSDVIVKLDADGQMNPEDIPSLVKPLLNGNYDYVKGNRFWSIEHIKEMPKIRLIGNLILSFMAKASTGYWNLFDPNNGFTAIKSTALRQLPIDRIEKGFFFESDILFRLNIEGCRATQISMFARYGDEKSNLAIYKTLPEFLFKHIRNFLKRIFYTYYLRDFSVASINLLLGVILLIFGVSLGLESWIRNLRLNVQTEPGTQILVAMTVLTGIQLLLSFINADVNRPPKEAN